MNEKRKVWEFTPIELNDYESQVKIVMLVPHISQMVLGIKTLPLCNKHIMQEFSNQTQEIGLSIFTSYSQL